MVKLFLESFAQGAKNAIEWWHIVAFNRKVPRCICWLIALITVPINLVIMLIGTIINKNFINIISEEMDKELEEAR